jgi:CheY-like chemotaxis protein
MAFFCEICKSVCRWICVPRAEEPERTQASGTFHILLASSDPYEIDNWVAELTEIDAEVIKVKDGLAALKAIKRQDFDVLVAAISMAERDGLEVLKELNHLPKPPIRILVSRGCDVTDRAYLRLARLYGADVTLTQPLQSGALGWHIRKTAGIGIELPSAETVTAGVHNRARREKSEVEERL